MTKTTELSPGEVDSRLAEGDGAKIDETLDKLGVTKDSAGNDTRQEPDSEGSNSSSKDLDAGSGG